MSERKYKVGDLASGQETVYECPTIFCIPRMDEKRDPTQIVGKQREGPETACYTQPVFEVISKTGPGALTCNIVLRVWSTDCLLSGVVRKSTNSSELENKEKTL